MPVILQKYFPEVQHDRMIIIFSHEHGKGREGLCPGLYEVLCGMVQCLELHSR